MPHTPDRTKLTEMRRGIAIACMAAIGCSPKDSAAPPPPPPPVIGLQVIAQGIEPRMVVRYQLAKGVKTALAMTGDNELGSGRDRVPWPTVETTSELSADDVLPDGTMKIRYTVTAATARDRPNAQVTAAQMAPGLQDLVGTSITGTLTPSGVLANLAVDTGDKQLPPALANQVSVLTRALDRMVMPLPDRPVGVGAQWRFQQPLDQTGIQLQATTTIQATVITPATLTISLTSTISGPDQDTTAAGPKVKLSHITGTMTGTGTIDLTRLTLAGELVAELHMDMTADGQTEPSVMKTTLHFTPQAPQPPPAPPAQTPVPAPPAPTPVPAPPAQGAQNAP